MQKIAIGERLTLDDVLNVVEQKAEVIITSTVAERVNVCRETILRRLGGEELHSPMLRKARAAAADLLGVAAA